MEFQRFELFLEGAGCIIEWDVFDILISFMEISSNESNLINAVQFLSVLLSSGCYRSVLFLGSGVRYVASNEALIDRLSSLRNSVRDQHEELGSQLGVILGTVKNQKKKGKLREEGK